MAARPRDCAVGRNVLDVIWHLLSDPDARFIDLGPDHNERNRNTDIIKQQHIRQLESLGYHVPLKPAA